MEMAGTPPPWPFKVDASLAPLIAIEGFQTGIPWMPTLHLVHSFVRFKSIYRSKVEVAELNAHLLVDIDGRIECELPSGEALLFPTLKEGRATIGHWELKEVNSSEQDVHANNSGTTFRFSSGRLESVYNDNERFVAQCDDNGYVIRVWNYKSKAMSISVTECKGTRLIIVPKGGIVEKIGELGRTEQIQWDDGSKVTYLKYFNNGLLAGYLSNGAEVQLKWGTRRWRSRACIPDLLPPLVSNDGRFSYRAEDDGWHLRVRFIGETLLDNLKGEWILDQINLSLVMNVTSNR